MQNSRVHELPVPDFIAPCLASGKEVFDAFLLLHYCQQMGKDSNGKILYQDFQSGLEQDIVIDSLSPKHNGMRSPDMAISHSGARIINFSPIPFCWVSTGWCFAE